MYGDQSYGRRAFQCGRYENEFISSVSHELRTPLTAIRGWAETIRTERDPVIFKKGIRVITNETERLSQMVEELLDFSRMQSGHFTLQQSAMDVLAELGEAALIYAERAKIEDITMTYEEPEMLPVVYGDKTEYVKCLSILLIMR